MRKDALTVLALIGLAGAAVYWEPIAASFDGMTPLDGLQTITAFFIKWAVIGLCVWAVSTIPDVVKPWLRMLRRNARSWRPGPNARWQGNSSAQPRMPRLTAEQRFLMLLARMNQQGGRNMGSPRQNPPSPTPTGSDEQIHIDW